MLTSANLLQGHLLLSGDEVTIIAAGVLTVLSSTVQVGTLQMFIYADPIRSDHYQ